MADSWLNFEEMDSDTTILLSAIEHYSYCPRQCALIHLEQTYEENLYTIKGLQVHESVDNGSISSIRGVKALRAVPLWSTKYGLRGKADLIEFKNGLAFPVEYKLGSKGSKIKHAALQLCAQALCLEEMLSKEVPSGALYLASTRQRIEIEITQVLREQTLKVVAEIRQMLKVQQIPNAPNDKRCNNCSLINSCLPSVAAEPTRLRGIQSTLFIPFGNLEGE